MNPYEEGLTDLIGELSTGSEEFRAWWAAHGVRLRRSGTQRLHHRIVGDLDLCCQGFALGSDPGLMLFICTAEPGSPSQEALNLLASWAGAHVADIPRVESAQPEAVKTARSGVS